MTQKTLHLLTTWTKLLRLQIGALCGTYGLIISLFFLAHLTAGENINIIGLLNHAIPWLALGSTICATIALISPHRKVWILYNLPPIIITCIIYAPQFLPKTAPKYTQNQTTFTVATFNIKMLNENKTPKHTENIWNLIQTLNIDIIGLQEVAENPFTDTSNLYPYNLYTGTIGIMSHFPFDTDNIEKLGIRFGEDSLAIFRTEANIQNTKIAIYVSHFVRPRLRLRPLNYDPSLREESVNDLIKRLKTETLPTILLCDCNMSPDSEAHDRIRHYLTDSWEKLGFGFGFTAPTDPNDLPIPVMRSDYVWYSNLNLLDIKIGSDSGSSDHYPVIATFSVPAD